MGVVSLYNVGSQGSHWACQAWQKQVSLPTEPSYLLCTPTRWTPPPAEHSYPLSTPSTEQPYPLRNTTPWTPLPSVHPCPLSTPTCWAILLAWENLFKENRLNLFPLNKKNLRTEKQFGLALYKNNPLSKPSRKGIYLEFLSPWGLLFTFSPLPLYLELNKMSWLEYDSDECCSWRREEASDNFPQAACID